MENTANTMVDSLPPLNDDLKAMLSRIDANLERYRQEVIDIKSELMLSKIMVNQKKYYTTDELAHLIGLSPKRVRDRLNSPKDKLFVGIKVDSEKSWKIETSQVNKILKAYEQSKGITAK